jgi:GntR family transcriptional repressor for pyruvate dehydrogenase complex
VQSVAAEGGSEGLLPRLVDVILAAAAEQKGEQAVRLPSEREMAQTLGIQRSTLREGLATLTHLGMLQRTPGRGTYVGLPQADFMQLYFDVGLAIGHITVDDLETVREMLEREIVRRVAQSGEPRDAFELEELARRMEEAASTEAKLEADYEFHRRLAAAANSPVVELLMEGLSTALRRVMHYRRFRVRSVPDAAKRMDATHLPIALAIRRKNPKAAVAAMDDHFSVWSELSEKVLPAKRKRRGASGATTATRKRKT